MYKNCGNSAIWILLSAKRKSRSFAGSSESLATVWSSLKYATRLRLYEEKLIVPTIHK